MVVINKYHEKYVCIIWKISVVGNSNKFFITHWKILNIIISNNNKMNTRNLLVKRDR